VFEKSISVHIPGMDGNMNTLWG